MSLFKYFSKKESSTPKDSLPYHSGRSLTGTKYASAMWQGLAITATSACTNSKSSIIVYLTGRKKHSSKFSLLKSLITPFVKILHRQTFAPYGISDHAALAACNRLPNIDWY